MSRNAAGVEHARVASAGARGARVLTSPTRTAILDAATLSSRRALLRFHALIPRPRSAPAGCANSPSHLACS